MVSPVHDIPALYERHAVAWDRSRSTGAPETTWLDRFRAAIPERGTILDLGCGTGSPVARYLIDHGHKVTGIDVSPTLIGLCRERFPQGEWHAADMRGLDLGRRFDGLLAWHSFFHLCADDQRRMFDTFAAHALPGAALMFTTGSRQGESVGEFEGDPLFHASLDVQEYEALLDAAGFRVLRNVVDDPACGGSTVWLASAWRG